MKNYVFVLMLVSTSALAQQTITLRALDYKTAQAQIDSQELHWGIMQGIFDTTVKTSATYHLIPTTFAPSSINKCSPLAQLVTTRDYLYQTVCVGSQLNQISDSLLTENLPTALKRFENMSYAGTCVEHSQISKRVLDESFTTLIYTLTKANNEMIDHVINLVYWRENGKQYGVTFDALLGYLAPLKPDGSFYTLDSLAAGIIDTPQNMKTKRYTLNVNHNAFCNLYITPKSDLFIENKFIYYFDNDDISILAAQQLVGNNYPRYRFLEAYSKTLANVLAANKPSSVKIYVSCMDEKEASFTRPTRTFPTRFPTAINGNDVWFNILGQTGNKNQLNKPVP